MAEFSSGIKLSEGDRIKGYEVTKVFDPGAFAFACKAISSSGRTVFLKKYKRPGGSSPWLQGFIDYQTELKARIQRDPVASKLCYEFIEFFERSKAGGAVPLRAFYQVFEWVDGGSDLRGVLNALRADPSAYDWNQRVVFARVMTAGVHAIHQAGAIHTDLKPENFYLLPDPTIVVKWKVRVIDMDFSLIEGRQAPWHGYEGYVGTPGYMSPEHLAGALPEKGSDVFTLSIILSELLGSGHPTAEDMEGYEQRVRDGALPEIQVQRPIERVPDVEFLNKVINACLRPEPARRPTAEQLLKALNGNLSSFDGMTPKGASAAPAPLPPLSPEKLRPKPLPVPEAFPDPARPAVPADKPATSPGPRIVELRGPAGETIKVGIPTKFGRALLKRWGDDYEKFMSPEQFHLSRDSSGQWSIEHCAQAKNATNVDGTPLTAAVAVRDGMTVTLGKTGKCPIKLTLV